MTACVKRERAHTHILVTSTQINATTNPSGLSMTKQLIGV